MFRKTCILLAAVMLSIAFAANVHAGVGPSMVVEPESFDFGTVDEGDMPQATFTIKNVGDEELQILDVKRSCGCTVTKLENKTLAPGESTTLVATYNSKGKRGGKISKTVTIMTNDQKNQSKVVKITGEVKAAPGAILTLNASGLTQLKMFTGESEKRLVNVGNVGELDLVIEEITAPKSVAVKIGDYSIKPGQTMLMDLVIKPKEVRTMELVITPDATVRGRFTERVTIRSNNKGRPVTPLAVAGTVEARPGQ